MSNQVIIFDTTLRDGEQALKASLTVKEKLQIALALERLGVDVMEVGFPVSSEGDFQSVQAIAKAVKNSRVCALSRAVAKDIDAAYEALRVAKAFRIHTFIATSALHVEAKLKRSFDDVVEMAVAAVKRARGYTDDVEFSCEDAGRTGVDNICRIVEAAINAGATTINIPDTVGYTLPTQFGSIIENVMNRVPNIDKAIISVHCHNDLGMATANSLTAVQYGARQIECTINGIGERAGNTALEEVVMAMRTRKDLMDVTTNINTQEIYRVSQLVSQICNMPIQPNKAIVGSNAFAHSSGIHQDGVLKNANTYEILSPESIGLKKEKLNLTARSGRAAVKKHMSDMGYGENDYDLDKLYEAFLKLADKKGQVFDYDLEALAFIDMQQGEDVSVQLQGISVQSASHMPATASVKLAVDHVIQLDAATGNGPVDAVYNCILRITGMDLTMTSYQLSAKGEGKDALGQVDIVVDYKGRKFHGVGLATDIIEASALALIHAINAIKLAKKVADVKSRKIMETV
ncbi:2-isopropylmalate synthase [Gallibacterium anatis]|uniref:2-isopropylmalate synthase n=1 Tax=Gallibacterium anatis TaxID=750 RepID=A0AAX3XDG4_9PAST|nr:2-isopropylmalate synthase [Gallibacterium anatis]KGQ40516.1 2-isopropylmalate synthase [Gallibacterium anatis IPDH697-78]KGQ46946.1 2-isopropylmalate synthase [Gallibacterium anatis]KGQ63052.1 2-isopropylmalate synthase [Gallibacterium anatis 7990]MDK9430847.1 2-isopropylmalate synthase [Gallibacterium anatis]UZD16136.1 2-isopropylmalate synthase [Gallibacterium anatis]